MAPEQGFWPANSPRDLFQCNTPLAFLQGDEVNNYDPEQIASRHNGVSDLDASRGLSGIGVPGMRRKDTSPLEQCALGRRLEVAGIDRRIGPNPRRYESAIIAAHQ